MSNTLGIDYNSQKSDLIISEYGRSVQELVAYAKTVEDPARRQRIAEMIVEVMRIVNPQKSAFEDVTVKLWKHLFRIAGYELDVTPPFGEKPTQPAEDERPEALPYPVQEVRFRHYGHHIQMAVRKAVTMEPGPKRDEFIKIIGSYMKMAYKTWNREQFVSDDLIRNDLETLSGHQLGLDGSIAFDTALALVSYPQQAPLAGSRKSKGGQHRSPSRNRQGQAGNFKSRRRR